MPQKRDHIVFSQKTATTSEYKIYSVKDLIFLGTIKGKFKKTEWKCLDENGNLLTTLKAKKEAMDFFREMDTKRMMAKGGGLDKRILVVLDEGNGKVINDLYTQWNNIKTDKEQANWNEKVKATTFGTYGTISIKEVLDKFDFDNSNINEVQKKDFKAELNQALKYAKGGGIDFEKLSDKVAKNYEGDKVAPKYQHEYGKTYSKSEAKEVGDKVAGKVYWQQQGRKMAMGGSILNEYEEEEFQKWKKDGNVSKNADGTYSTQDAQFRNSLKNLTELKEYFKKEFFSDSYYANGGSVEEYRTKSIERQRKEEEGKTFAPFKAYVYENSPSGANQFNATESDSFAAAVKWAKEQLISQRNFRKNSDLLWAQVSKFVPVEERNNVIYAYKDVARFDEEQVESIKYANGGSMSGGMKNFYILLDNGTKKEYTVKAPKDIAGIYFAGGYDRGATTLEKGLPMVHYDNALRPLYNQDDTLVEAYPQYAGMDYDDLKSKMEDGGNVDESYERTFRNNTGKDILVKIIKNPIFGKYDYWVDGSVRGTFDTFAQARQEVNYENFDMYKQGGTIYSKDESMNIAQTILSQMGGRRRLEAFTGAYNFAVGDGSVMFRIKNRKVNVVKVKLNGKDLYDVTFGRISGTNYKVVEESNDVYAEDLIDFFERETGMYLRMEKGGSVKKPMNILYDVELYIKNETKQGFLETKGIEDGHISYSSRISPNVSEGKEYNELVEHTLSLKSKLNKKFGKTIDVEMEYVDEWVGLEITQKNIYEEARDKSDLATKMIFDIAKHIKSIASEKNIQVTVLTYTSNELDEKKFVKYSNVKFDSSFFTKNEWESIGEKDPQEIIKKEIIKKYGKNVNIVKDTNSFFSYLVYLKSPKSFNNKVEEFATGGGIENYINVAKMKTITYPEAHFEQNFRFYKSLIENKKNNWEQAQKEYDLVRSRVPFTTWFLELKKGQNKFEFLENIYEIVSEKRKMVATSYMERSFHETTWGIKSIEINNKETQLSKFKINVDGGLGFKTKADVIESVNYQFENLILRKIIDVPMPNSKMATGGNLYDSEFYKNGGSVYPDLSLQKADVVNDSIQLNEFKIQKTKNLFTINGLEKKKITQSKDVVSILRSLWEKDTINAYEQAYVLYLNNANTVIGYYHHSKGSITGTVMDIQMITGMALKSLAKGVIIAHNHPSENKQPSDADKKITSQLKEGLKVFSIVLLDSVIITDESYFSFADEGLI